jgi:hypothetical protein
VIRNVRSTVLLAVAATLALALGAGSARAAERCKVKIDKKTGVLEVSASDVDAATLLWGEDPGAVTSAFFDATCIEGAKAKGCTLADPASLAAKTPPAGCTLHLSDANGPCSAWIAGCTPQRGAVNKQVVLQPGDFTGSNSFVFEGSAVSGIAEITDADLSDGSLVQVEAQNQGGYWLQLPVNVLRSDGAFERIHVSHEGDTLRLYYQRFTPPATTANAPANPLNVRYRIVDAAPN